MVESGRMMLKGYLAALAVGLGTTLAAAPLWAAEPLAYMAPLPAPPPPSFPPYPGWRLEPPAKPPAETSKGPKWYGWQTIIGLAASDLLLLGGSKATILLFPGIAGVALTSPIVHWTHGNLSKGYWSLGINVLTPVLGASFLLNNETATPGIALLGLSLIAWPIVDIAFLSYDDPAEKNDAARKKKQWAFGVESIGVVPMIDRDRGGFSLVGTF